MVGHAEAYQILNQALPITSSRVGNQNGNHRRTRLFGMAEIMGQTSIKG